MPCSFVVSKVVEAVLIEAFDILLRFSTPLPKFASIGVRELSSTFSWASKKRPDGSKTKVFLTQQTLEFQQVLYFMANKKVKKNFKLRRTFVHNSVILY